MKSLVRSLLCILVVFSFTITGCQNPSSDSPDPNDPGTPGSGTPGSGIPGGGTPASGTPVLSNGSVNDLLTWMGTTATISFHANTGGTYYYCVQYDSISAPSVDSIKAHRYVQAYGTGSCTVGINTVNVTGLNSTSKYIAYFVLETDNGVSAILPINNISPISKFESWTVLKNDSLPFGGYSLQSVVCFDGKFYVSSSIDEKIASSSDGITWTLITSPFSGGTRIEYGNGRLVAVSSEYDFTKNAVVVLVKYSLDSGSTWRTSDTSAIKNDSPKCIKFIDDKFFLMVDDEISYSTDASTWTPVSTNIGQPIYDIAYGDGTLIAVSYTIPNCTAYSTDDGVTWTKHNELYEGIGGDVSINCIAYGKGTFIFAGDNGIDGYSKDRGATWHYDSGGYTEVFGLPITALSMIYTGGTDGFFVATANFSRIAYSADGMKWRRLSLTGLSYSMDYIVDVATNGNRFVVVTNRGELAYTQ